MSGKEKKGYVAIPKSLKKDAMLPELDKDGFVKTPKYMADPLRVAAKQITSVRYQETSHEKVKDKKRAKLRVSGLGQSGFADIQAPDLRMYLES